MSATARKAPYTKSDPATRRDAYQELTDTIVAALEAGKRPWVRPWDPSKAGGPAMPVNAVTGRRYRGINVLVLSIASFAFGGDPRFCTYKQATEAGWQVKAGSKSTTVFFYKKLTVIDRDAPAGSDDTKTIPMIRTFNVFNGSQIEGIPAFILPTVEDAPWRRPEAAEIIVRNSGAVVRTGGERAFYAPGEDFVQMPTDSSFADAGGWASTMLHEMAHWTGHKSRLARVMTGVARGSSAYAQEELRAELASVFLGAELGLPCDLPNNVSYLAEWVTALRNDKREIFHAASAAQKIADMLLGFHPEYAAAAVGVSDPVEEAS